MKRILSIQSHVAYGYVGNRAAVFPLQRMGYDVTAINTVQFSNHPGYGTWTGEIFSPTHIRNLVNGLRDLGILHKFDAVLSGYLGDAGVGEVVLETVAEIKKHNPACLWCCDPVMGDVGKGLFVKPDIPKLFQSSAVRLADIMTPNVFELEQLTSITITSLADAKKGCASLHAQGVKTVLVTSLLPTDTSVNMLASSSDGSAWHITTPYLPLNPMPSGTGDLVTAVFLGHLLNGHNIQSALEHTTAIIYHIIEKTGAATSRELLIIDHFQISGISGTEPQKLAFSARPALP
ncbi:MAG: pyridoxal kinase PdxY [Alphaproteobacteria bacterium]|nr:pyridoxal kinase PdxY [Alphaproteobacteria bacterium]